MARSFRHRVQPIGKPLAAPVRVLHLSDLHASSLVPMSLIEEAIRLGLERKPDIICLTGDFINFVDDFDTRAYVNALRRLSAAAPAFAVVGNHDGGLWTRSKGRHADHKVVHRILETSGIEFLHNRSHHTQAGGGLTLVGVGDYYCDEIDGPKAFSGVRPAQPIVALAHNPDSKDVLAPFHWDLMLSGHTHGGQLILPFCGYRFAPVKDKRYVAGLKAWGTRQIHVTRGVGSWAGVRFRCRPEVSLLVIE